MCSNISSISKLIEKKSKQINNSLNNILVKTRELSFGERKQWLFVEDGLGEEKSS
ncbi:hypothetical protein RV18_GL002183 [Enterococcus termitis]|nr:hypothetical protein RV18_GL002183 [Enterococcus termitis]